MANKLDPVAQTFFIDESNFPEGIMISSVDLFFSRKDENGVPVQLYLLEVDDNGPTDRIIDKSEVVKKSANITTSLDGDTATNFKFDDPIYLKPGEEYAVAISTNSKQYTLYTAEMGSTDILSDNEIGTQPNVGKLYRSQNGSEWEPENTIDLKFNIKRASFIPNTDYIIQMNVSGLSNTAIEGNTEYHVVKTVVDQNIPGNTSVNYTINTRSASTLNLSGETPFNLNKNFEFGSTRIIRANTANEVTVRGTMRTQSNTVSPQINTKRAGFYAITNRINSKSELTLDETEPQGPGGFNNGDANAKYITRRVTLQDGFESTGLKVFLDVNKPFGTSIEVYYKVLSEYDPDDFDDKQYVLMSKDNADIVLNSTERENQYIEEEYTAENISYVSDNTTYNDFKTFAIKVVLYSTNPAKTPKIRNFRAISTL